MANGTKSPLNAFWLIVIGLLIVAGIMVFFRDVASTGEQQAEQPQPPSTEWTTRPEGGVEVDLPEAPMRNVEAETGAEPQLQDQSLLETD